MLRQAPLCMLLLGRKELPIIFGISWIMYFCNSVTSSTYPLFSPPLVSLFSVNSSLSLYNPRNNPGERASKTLFVLTLLPTDLLYCDSSPYYKASQLTEASEAKNWPWECIPEVKGMCGSHAHHFPGQAVQL